MKMRIGAIYWDAALPEDTYFGGFTWLTLSNAEYAERLPYFARKNADGTYTIPARTQQEYDREFAYAAEAGIDFFACCWYPDSAEERTIGVERSPQLADHLHELNLGRKMYQSSPMNQKIGMCAIIFSSHSYAESDFDALEDALRADYYEKIGGRPLVLVFGGYDATFNRLFRERMAASGLDVYLVLLSNFGTEDSPDGLATVDGISAYASTHGAETFGQLTERTREDNERRLKYGIPSIPMLSMGWDPTPRITRRNTWVTYDDIIYPPAPTKADIEAAFASVSEHMERNIGRLAAPMAIVFAWNEFEEGGRLCPILGEDGRVNTTITDAFREVRERYR